MERPKTTGPIACGPGNALVEETFPIPDTKIERKRAADAASKPPGGNPGSLIYFEKEDRAWSHLVMVDTPDLDSIEPENRRIAKDICLLSDVIVFVTSQEKYADEVPGLFLKQMIRDQRPVDVILNKAREPLEREAVLDLFRGQGMILREEDLWPVFYASSGTVQDIAAQPAFRAFESHLKARLSRDKVPAIKQDHLSKLGMSLKSGLEALVGLLERENRAAETWIGRLEGLYETGARDLVREERGRFTETSGEVLKHEIRKLFARYDVLARPRRFIQTLALTPFRLLGLADRRSQKTQTRAIETLRRKMDLAPILGAVERMNRQVMEELSPREDTSPLFGKLREPPILLDEDAVRALIEHRHRDMVDWLEKTFQQLARDIPRGKRWGIYSTSILWGILILSFETAVGGGLSVVDAALDSALAPFVTKGAVELFAFREIRKIAAELAARYEKGILDPLREQRDRYRQCIRDLMTDPETLGSLRDLRGWIDKTKPDMEALHHES